MPRMDEKAVLAVESNLTFRVAKDSENLDTVLDFLNYMCTSDYGRSWVPSVIGDISPLTGADALIHSLQQKQQLHRIIP
ncbi:MAG: hypothetical protein ACLTZM_18015 [Ruminococcus sp.]